MGIELRVSLLRKNVNTLTDRARLGPKWLAKIDKIWLIGKILTQTKTQSKTQ